MRRFFVWLHRWVGLLLAALLILEGLTGALIAFRLDLTRWLDPHSFSAQAVPVSKQFGLASLAEHAETAEPTEEVGYFAVHRDDQVVLRMNPRIDPTTGKPFALRRMFIALDPATGRDLGAGAQDRDVLARVMPFVYELHINLALGEPGSWALAIAALLWTLDCFVGFYLTLPQRWRPFWRRWKAAWLVKRRASAFRINFDLHRAGGLWFWPLLFVFAWSSVNLEEPWGIYDWVTGHVFETRSTEDELAELFPNRPGSGPLRLDWRGAQAAGERLMAQRAAADGFHIEQALSLNRFPESRMYNYMVRTDRHFPEDRTETVFFDADTGAFHGSYGTRTGHTGNTVTNWLRALHMVSDPLDYLPYRILVSVAGLLIVLLSVTGVYLWLKKRHARLKYAQQRGHLV